MPKRLLLISPEFYGLEKKIKLRLEESGYEVKWINNINLSLDFKGRNSKFKLLRKIYFFLFSPRERFVKRELEDLDNLRFDILFSINCNIICPYLFNRLKGSNPGLLSILYLWDSFSMYSWEKEISLFDKVYTFDRIDSETFKIEYKPNFFVRSYENKKFEIKYELSFAGKFSAERFRIIENLNNQLIDSKIRHIFLLWPAYKVFFHNSLLYKILKHIGLRTRWIESYILTYEANENLLKKDYIAGDRISYEDVQLQLLCSNVILDLPYEHQSGYTHRLIEALANGKKIITTNPKIRKESFFNTEQIYIMDAENPVVDINWIIEKEEFKVDGYINELELSKWLTYILNAKVA